MLRWRTQALEIEEARLKRLFAARARLEASVRHTKAQWERENASVRGSDLITGRLLAQLAEFEIETRRRLSALAKEIGDLQDQIELQQSAVLEAQRAVKAIEKLKERRKQEWTVEMDRELEALAADSFLARWAPVEGS